MPDVYTDTDVAAGGTGTIGDPYASFNEAWEAEDSNIDPGETWNFYFRGTAADTAAVVMDSWPTVGDGDVVINLLPWPGADDGRYTGDDNWSTSHYRLEHNGSSHTLAIQGDNATGGSRTVNVQGLQIGNSSTTNGRYIFELKSNCAGTVNVDDCRIKHSGTGTFPRMFRADATITVALEINVTNSLMIYTGTTLCSAFNINDALVTTNIYNCTIHYGASGGGGEDCIDDETGCTTTAQNNVIIATAGTNCEFDIAGTITKDYNAHTNSADRGTNGWAIANSDFTSGGTGDTDELTPVASPATDWDESDLTNADDSNVPTLDIRGNDRNTAAGTTTAAGCFAKSDEGTSGVTGTSAQTLPSITQSAAGETDVTGTAVQALSSFTQSAIGLQIYTGTVVQTFPSVSQAAAGSVVSGIGGTITQTLPAFTQSATGIEVYTGTIVQTLPSFTQQALGAAAGTVGSIVQTLPSFSQTSAGLVTYTGTSAQTLPSFTQLAAGTIVVNVTGTATQILPSVSQSAAGTVAVAVTGTTTQALPSLTQSATGSTPIADVCPPFSLSITSDISLSGAISSEVEQSGVLTIGFSVGSRETSPEIDFRVTPDGCRRITPAGDARITP